MVGAEVKRRALPCPGSQRLKKIRLQNPVLMVAFFRPRVGKEHPDLLQGYARWQRIEKLPRLGLHEMTVG